MRTRRVVASVLTAPIVALAGCNGVPKVTPGTTTSPGPVVTTVGPGTVLTDALTEAHCRRVADGTWAADGVVKNTTKRTRSLDVNIYVGPADGKAGVAHVVTLKKLAAGKSAPWKASAVQVTSATGPCYIRVRISK